MSEHVDVIVVGAGSSGGIVAARLSEDAGRSVLLLEAGPDFPREAEVGTSFSKGIGLLDPIGLPEYDWQLVSEPVLGDGHRVALPRGRLVGGSSMVNGTVAVRAAPADFDAWASAGNAGWGWDDVLPVLTRLEHDHDFGDEPYHGADGPMHIQRYAPGKWSPVHYAFVDGCQELGLRFAPDLNAPDAFVGCVGPWPQNRWGGERLGTLTTYLREARPRPSLEIRARTLVDRVLVRGDRALGVQTIDAAGRVAQVFADLVVVSAGVYLTPAILQRSGIGPAGVLRGVGIDCLHDLPVGESLSDHANVMYRIASEELAAEHGAIFLANCRGPASAEGTPRWQALAVPVDERTGHCAVIVNLARQESLGHVRLRSADPTVAPIIDHGYLTAEADLEAFDEGWEFCSDLVSTAPFRAAGARPDNDPTSGREAARRAVGTAYHAAGSCRMGPPGDPTSVVDPHLRVHGIDGLLVADASIFPRNILFNPNLTAYAVGEIAAELIRGGRQAGTISAEVA